MKITVEELAIVFFCILSDMILGSLKAIKFKTFNTKTLVWGFVLKSVQLCMVALSVRVFDMMGHDGDIFFSGFVMIMSVTELFSAWSNLYMIKTGKIVKRVDFFMLILKMMRHRIDKMVGKAIGEDVKDCELPGKAIENNEKKEKDEIN